MQFQRYMHKYGKSHDMMAPFMINSRENGLKFPEGYWAQHRPEHLTYEDYVNARWVAKPANLFDNDIPIMASAAYLFTTADRAKDMAQKPVYILNHARNATVPRSGNPTLEECEEATANTGRMLYEGAGISADDLSFENMYDGFSLFHVFHLEGLRFRGIQPGEALDYFASEDISNTGPAPISPSGGNVGSGRTRFWMHTDCIQQIQGRAGERQMTAPANIGVSGGPMPTGGCFTVWASEPN
jgi:acetyl-CoA acetyltransferase